MTSPAQMAAILRGLEASPERTALVKDQLRQAQEMQQHPAIQYRTPLAAGLGGLANAVSSWAGAYKERKASDELKGMADALRDARATYAKEANNLLAGSTDREQRLGALSNLQLPTGEQAAMAIPSAPTAPAASPFQQDIADKAQSDAYAKVGIADALRGALGSYGGSMAQQQGDVLSKMQALGTTGIASGDPVVGGTGHSLVQQSQFGQELLEKLAAARAAREAKPSEPWQQITAKDGKVYWGDPRNPTGAAIPAIGPDKQQLVKDPPLVPVQTEQGMVFVNPRGVGGAIERPKQELQQSDREHLESLGEEKANLQTLSSTFKDSFSGGGPLGKLSVGFDQTVGGFGSPAMQERADWWSNFDVLKTLPERNKTFGSSLTPGEKASWERARRINEGTDPKQVRKVFGELQQIVERKIDKRRQSLISDRARPEAVDAALGATPSDSGLTPEEEARLQELESKAKKAGRK